MNYLEDLQSIKEIAFKNGSDLYFYIQDNKDFRDKIYNLSLFFLERRLGSCDSCYMDSYIQLYKMDLDFAKNKVECKFKLADEQLIYLEGKPITNYNLDNDKAIRYLKEHPEDKHRFTLLPDNLENLLSETIKQTEEINNTTKVKEPLKSNKNKVGRPKKSMD